MNDKMRRQAAKMKAAKIAREEALAELVSQVRDEFLTREEAAQCLAGAILKAAHAAGQPSAAGLKYAQLLVDQALDGDDFEGLVIGRHT